MTDTKIAERKAHLPFLIFACVASALGGFLWGFDAIVISGTITLVKAQFALGSAMEGLYVSSGLIGAVIGSAAAGTLSERLGRRRNLILAATLLLVSALGSMLAGSIGLLVLARWIGGLGVGISAMVCPVYISEMSPAKLRGRLVTVFQFAITFGIMAALFNNAGLNSWSNSLAAKGSVEGFWKWVLVDQTWRSMFGSELLPGAIFFILALFLPESPRWLIKSGIKDKASHVLSLIYKQGGEDVLGEIEESLRLEGSRKLPFSALFKPPYNRYIPLGIALAAFAQFSGINVVFYYGPTLLEKVGFASSGALSGMAIIGFFNMIFTLIAVAWVDKFGRKMLLQVGTIGALVCLVCIGLMIGASEPSILLIVLICTFVAFFAFSLGPIKFIVASEIFPTQVRSHAVSVVILSMWAADTIVGQFFPMLRDAVGAPATFWIFAGILFFQLPVIWFWMPETANYTLEEIETWYEQ